MIYPITPQTALLIIDAQREYSSLERPLYTADFSAIAEKINIISKLFREKGFPVFIIKHLHDTSGLDVGRMGDFSTDEVFTKGDFFSELDESIITEKSDIVIEKTRYSSFINTNLESYLKTLGVDTILITGFMSGYCCVTTARHAHDLDYKVLYVDDATSGPVFGDLGFGDLTIEEVKNVISTLLMGGVAEVIKTNDVTERMP